MELAHPRGVIAGLVPMTNAVATAVFKSLFAIKGRNAFVLSFHRKAMGVGGRTGEIIQSTLLAHGAPMELVQRIRERSSRRKSVALMMHPRVGLVLATGGSEMVRAAYSSGTPAIGVGPGNGPVVVCADADLDACAAGVVGSKSFDNRLICASESNLIVEVSVKPQFVEALVAAGAAVLDDAESSALLAPAVDPRTHHCAGALVGQSAKRIQTAAGLRESETPSAIVLPAAERLVGNSLAGEKMAPILSVLTAASADEGMDLAR